MENYLSCMLTGKWTQGQKSASLIQPTFVAQAILMLVFVISEASLYHVSQDLVIDAVDILNV